MIELSYSKTMMEVIVYLKLMYKKYIEKMHLEKNLQVNLMISIIPFIIN